MKILDRNIKLNKPKVILFDWDNTLVDSLELICASMRDTFSKFKLNQMPEEELIKKIHGPSKLFIETHFPKNVHNKARQTFLDLYDQFSKEKLKTHYQDGSDLSGHVSHKGIPGVEFSTGSLGHGLPVATGMALAARINQHHHKVYVLMSDGECDEGSNWEAALFAPHHKLDNLVVIIDRNKLQSIHSTENTLNLEPFVDKWQAFGWNVVNIDGHNHQKLLDACGSMVSGKPLCIIANTIKGKGVSFMENNNLWHYRSPKGKEYDAAMQELNNA